MFYQLEEVGQRMRNRARVVASNPDLHHAEVEREIAAARCDFGNLTSTRSPLLTWVMTSIVVLSSSYKQAALVCMLPLARAQLFWLKVSSPVSSWSQSWK